MEKNMVRLGVLGLSGRGRGMLRILLGMDDVEITAVCDVYEDRLDEGANMVFERYGKKPFVTTDYTKLVKLKDLDGIVIFTSWTSHIEIALAAMEEGKYVATEVGGATNIRECFNLVDTSLKYRAPLMMLENCNYGREEMALLNMTKKGIFGELIHCQCGYEHDLRREVACGIENRHYRIHNYLNRNGDVYPTHGIGPVAKLLDINRGNRFISLCSMASKSKGINEWVRREKGSDHPLAKVDFALGDVVTTMIKCAHGETVLAVHDTSLPRPYSRNGRVQGTKGIWMEDNKSIHIEGRSPAHEWEPFEDYLIEYEHPLWKRYLDEGVKEGHGGMDYLVLRGFVESIMAGTNTPIDVYDTVTWMAITALSEDSIACGGAMVPFPDFTFGKWIEKKEINLGRYSLDIITEENI